MKKAEEILFKHKEAQRYFESSIKYQLGDVLEAMEEYADQYKQLLKKLVNLEVINMIEADYVLKPEELEILKQLEKE